MSAIQRMIDEMQRRGYASKTIKEYSGSLRRLATYFGCCPSKLTLEQIRQYQVHLAGRNDISASYYNSTVTAMRFMYLETLGRDWSIERLPYGRREHRLPVVLSRQEVFQLWRPLRQLKRRLLLMTAYSAALRTSELVHLRVEDLDAKQMQIRVKQDGGKGERFVPYSPTLKRLMGPYLAEHDSPWLFPGESQRASVNHLGGTQHLRPRRAAGQTLQGGHDHDAPAFGGDAPVGAGSRSTHDSKGPWPRSSGHHDALCASDA